MRKMLLLALTLLLAQTCFAGAEGHHQPPAMPKEFEALKTLVGKWEGTTKMHDKEEKTEVTYALTSGGTAIMETMMPGTPHEMVSIYHKAGKSLAMTHYCALGNQPYMPLKKADKKSISFELKKPVGISSMKEEHMHAVTLTLQDNDTLVQDWVNYKGGKKAGNVTFTLKRQ